MAEKFNLFERLNISPPRLDEELKTFGEECLHLEYITERETILCLNCGLELTEKNWETMYEKNIITDNTRCYTRKSKDPTVYQDLKNLNIDENIKDIANDIYVECCGTKIHRGCIRRSIVFAAVFHAYKINNTPQNFKKLIKEFNIKRKNALKGIKFINENAPTNSPLRSVCITPETHIKDFMHRFGTPEYQIQHVIDLYRRVKGKSSVMNSSRPQSIAAGLIYYYSLKTKRNVNIKEFTKTVDMSELTINKVSKECKRIFDAGVV
jgi:transcription initiation factor TFIIIB Brf1 subunit/transcription initiation factor TFIIB